ncbi:hypothetical protein ACWGGS_24450 [Streptomyces decoyicus]
MKQVEPHFFATTKGRNRQADRVVTWTERHDIVNWHVSRPTWGGVMGSIGGLALVLIFAVVWVLIALVPLRSPSARKAWGRGVLGVSVLLVLIAALFGATADVGISYEGPSPALLTTLGAAIVVAPGAITALVRSGKNS